MTVRFNPPPNWPAPPIGWAPPLGWRPDPAWGAPPAGWQVWVEVAAAALDLAATPVLRAAAGVEQPATAANGTGRDRQNPLGEVEIPLFGARGRARDLAAEVGQLKIEMGACQGENDRLRTEMARLGMLSAMELERRQVDLTSEIAEQTAALQRQSREHAVALDRQAQEAAEHRRHDITVAEAQKARLEERLHELQQLIVVTEETALLQEVGIYRYRHPLTDAVAYQARLAQVQDRIRTMTRRDGGAVLAATGWTVNGSRVQGQAMVRDFSKLMLRAYNAEADNLVRSLKPYKLDSAVDRLTKVAATIVRLGKTMDIRIADAYHQLRIQELELTADHQEQLAEQKERERVERDRLREERRVEQELERERLRLDKQRQHYENMLAALAAKGDRDGAVRYQEQLAEIEQKIQAVDYRAANVRAGYVYVISNVGAFGKQMVKVGMTRRLDPLDRVRELGDASVPFKFDVHALFFSEDAVGIEAKMHACLSERRVNRVNQRREFFYATPHEVKEHLLALTGDLLQYDEMPEALEYHQSLAQNETATAAV